MNSFVTYEKCGLVLYFSIGISSIFRKPWNILTTPIGWLLLLLNQKTWGGKDLGENTEDGLIGEKRGGGKEFFGNKKGKRTFYRRKRGRKIFGGKKGVKTIFSTKKEGCTFFSGSKSGLVGPLFFRSTSICKKKRHKYYFRSWYSMISKKWYPETKKKGYPMAWQGTIIEPL